MQLPMS